MTSQELKQKEEREMTERQLKALMECAEGLKDVINADPPYSQTELEEVFAPLLGELYESGILLPGEE